MARSHAIRAHMIVRPTRTKTPKFDVRCAMGVPAAKVLRDLQRDM